MMARTSNRMDGYKRAVMLVLAAAVLAIALTGCGSASGVSPGASGPGVQHFDVSLASGAYAPNALTAKAGEPVEITFGQGQGCVGTLVFPQFDINADMTKGPQTFNLGALEPGQYQWSCGMNMQHGTLTVR